MGVAYALKQDNDRAFEWLDKAVKLGFSAKNMLKTDGWLNNIRDDARFKALIEK